MAAKANILLLFTDDQRFDTIAALGNEDIHTPHMDELVRSGTAFTRAHIPGGTTGAVCMPSRAMLHTGRTLFHLDKHGKHIPDEHAMLGETLRQAGYRTFGTGKWHNGPSSYARSFADGGEIFFGGMWDHWNVPANDFDPTGRYERTSPFITNAHGDNTITEQVCDHIHMGKHSSELFSGLASQWLDRYAGDEPFFMYVSFMAPHDPRSMPERFRHMYDPETIRLPDNFCAEHPFNYGLRRGRDESLAPYPRTPELVKRHIADYYGMISHLDHEIGNLIAALKRSGRYDDTIVVFAGDNGLALGQHGLFGKQNNYEHSIRVPLIFSGPGIPKNERRDAYAYLLDIFPTLCELTGTAVPPTVEGVSLVPALRDERVRVRETLYFAFSNMIRSVKDERHKLIEYRYGDERRTQLFDLLEDPHEQRNLYGLPEYEATVSRLRRELLRYKEEWEDERHPTGRAFWGRYAGE